MKNLSVIIPNYNYALFLDRRIKSIVNQTVKPCEILFLDDCSTDDSLDIAENLLSQCDIPWRIIKNDCNQGVFKQWLKGLELAQHDYLWIAEVDDYCELNFVEKLLATFDDEKVVLAYCQSRFVDQSGHEIDNYSNYISRYFDFSKWSQDYKENGIEEIRKYLCCTNTIPNASAVIFNKNLVDLSKISQIADYSNNGDWLFYILSLSSYPENKICYLSEPLNYFVRHQSSVFGKEENPTRPIVEFLGIMLYILEHFTIDTSAKHIMLKSLIGNLVYWPIDHDLNALVTKIMNYLPRDNFYIIYNQETEQIIARFKSKLNIYENRMKERDEYILKLESLLENNNNNILCRIIRKAKSLLSTPWW